MSAGQMYAVYRIAGQAFPHRWLFAEALAHESQDWRPGTNAVLDKPRNRVLHDRVDALARLFREYGRRFTAPSSEGRQDIRPGAKERRRVFGFWRVRARRLCHGKLKRCILLSPVLLAGRTRCGPG